MGLILKYLPVFVIIILFTLIIPPSTSEYEQKGRKLQDDYPTKIQKGSGYEQKGLDLHNDYRKIHKSMQLKLNVTLNRIAEACAYYYVHKGEIDHSCPYKLKGIGENLYLGWRTGGSNQPFEKHVLEAIKLWYDEIVDYSFEHPGEYKNMVGHFTQLVWNSSRQLGIGVFEYNLQTAVVALYTPRGNIVDLGNSDQYHLYKKNVVPTSGYSSTPMPPSASEYEQKGLELHNYYRKIHKSMKLKLNQTLNQLAQICAKYYVYKGAIDHSCPSKFKGMGENLYLGWRTGGSNQPFEKHVLEATKLWYNEILDYSFENPGEHTKMIGHFTQLVWNSSRLLGIGVFEYNLKTAVVALYTPQGNIVDLGNADRYHLYKKNVVPSSGYFGQKANSAFGMPKLNYFVLLLTFMLWLQ